MSAPLQSHPPRPDSVTPVNAGADKRGFRPAAAQAEVEALRTFLASAIERGATDVHLRAGDGVYARIDGQLAPLETPPLTSVDRKSVV